jgi:hypothetical protein
LKFVPSAIRFLPGNKNWSIPPVASSASQKIRRLPERQEIAPAVPAVIQAVFKLSPHCGGSLTRFGSQKDHSAVGSFCNHVLFEKLSGVEDRFKELEGLLSDKNILLEIRAGTGGDEAGAFASDLFRMYSRYAESAGWKVETMEQHTPSASGAIKEIIALISGQGLQPAQV